jgi:CheY-like chemotaxis protein
LLRFVLTAMLAPLKVLVVDDHADNVDSMEALLRALGCQTKGCYQAVEAANCAKEYQPDVVLLDLSMPGMSGFEVAREIRASAAIKRPVLVALTGEYTRGSDRLRAEMAAFDHFLVKPADPAVLKSILQQAQAP